METSIQTENAKILSGEGFIGRRNFIANFLVITIISTLLFIPLYSKTGYIDFLNSLKEINPFWSILFLFATLLYAILSSFNYKKRISDISGKNINAGVSYFICVFLIILEFVSIANLYIGYKIKIALIVFNILMFLLKGKFSSALPKNEIIRFNWGAFFGTWIWGIINKTYMTLLIIPLFFTPVSLFFMLLSGIKGNEWAYKNKKFDSKDEFHKSQKKQAIFWSIFTPVVSAAAFFILTVFVAGLLLYSEKSAEENPSKGPSIIETYYQSNFKGVINSYELSNDEYKFFADPHKWSKLTTAQKISIYINAIDFVKYKALKYGKNAPLSLLYKKTKIYSDLNNEILFETNSELLDMKDTKAILKNAYDFYKINKNPILEK